MSTVLVTGGSGYLGAHLLAALLREGRSVRTTVRSLDSEPVVRDAVRRGGADDSRLEVVTADLMSDEGWAAAVAGCDEVHHLATPFPATPPTDPDDLVVPAREGTLRVLGMARDAGVRRVVLTSSFAAVGYTPKPDGDYAEDDWTDPDSPGLAAYPRSKTVAERAAWDLLDGTGTELVVLNPTFILGPLLTAQARASVQIVQMMLEGRMEVAPRQRFGLVDVRDVADAHVRAMAAPQAAGRRFLLVSDDPTTTFLGLAQTLRDHVGPDASRVPTREAPGDDLPPLTIHNDRARAELGWRPRPAATTIAETAESLRELGLLFVG